MKKPNLIKEIESSPVYDLVIKTPLQYAQRISSDLKNQIFLKREDLQSVFSFKSRGAYHKIYNLTQQNKSINGVVAASAGNHAQGVALAAKKLGLKATIVMPNVTPSIKVQAVKKLGAQVILHGDRYDDACNLANQLAKEEKLESIHPFDDLLVITGQGTVGLEIYQQLEELNHCLKNTSIKKVINKEDYLIFVPVGGGGLISGVGSYLKYQYPNCKIISVEPIESPTLYQSFNQKKIVKLNKTGIFVDGVSVKQIGQHNFPICQKVVDECLLVSNDEICSAVEDIFNDTRSISEPSGALAVAGIKKYLMAHQLENKKMIAIVSGANLNFDRLRYIAERSKFGAKQELLLAVAIPEEIGSYQNFCKILKNHSITEFNYRFNNEKVAQIFVGIALEENQSSEIIISNLKKNGYKLINLMDNETAKTHIRHMVGGKNSKIKNERLISFTFPERKGALVDFLNAFQGWNISLFHYRSQGAPYGEVLAGMQVPDNELDQFKTFLANLGFEYQFQDENKACQVFL